jgi:D-alanyl-D-alanine carboxypeptidase
MKDKRKQSKILFAILLSGLLLTIVYSIFIYAGAVFAESEPKEELKHTSQIIKNPNALVQREQIEAKAFVIYDINGKKIIRSQNAELPLPIASLTKIITVGTLLDTAKKNKVEIREETKYRIKKALVQSSNEDADSLGYIYSYSFGRDLLQDSNELISSLGINNLHLTNLTGLDNYWDGAASNVGSAESMAKMFAFVYENYRDVFEYTKFEEVESFGEKIVNTNQKSNETFGILASKTGYTFEAGGNLGVIVSPEPGSAYVVLVMQSTKEGRFSDVKKIVNLLPIILSE